MKNYMKYPIIPIAFFYVNGIFFSELFFKQFSYKFALFFLFLLFLPFLFFFFFFNKKVLSSRLNKIYSLLIFCLFFFLGIYSYENFKDENKIIPQQYHYGVLTINEVLKSNKFQNRYYGAFLTSDGLNQKILLYQSPNSSNFDVGERIKVALFIEKISSSKNPTSFDYSKYLSNKNIFISANLPQQYLVLKPAQGVYFQLMKFRKKLMSSFDIQNFTPEVKGVVYALLFGQRADLSEKVTTDYRNAGVMHILAISGLHIGILYWMINLILRSFIRSSNIRFVVVISILCCFAVISGLSGSVVRAVLMFFIVGLGLMFQRKTNTINVLVLSMFAILIINPNFLFDIGFQLSYLAVFSIVYLYPLIQNKFKSRYIVLNYFLELIGISLVAQLGILPLTIYYFGQVPLLFLLGNLIVIPILTFVLIGLVFLLILNFVSKDLAVFFGKLIQYLIEFANYYISIIASKKDFLLTDIKLSLFQCIAFLGVVFFSAFAIKKYSFSKIVSIGLLFITLQFSYIYQDFRSQDVTKFQMFYDYNAVTLFASKNKSMLILSSDSLVKQKRYILEAIKENAIQNTEVIYITNYFNFCFDWFSFFANSKFCIERSSCFFWKINSIFN